MEYSASDKIIDAYRTKIASVPKPITSSDWKTFNKLQPLSSALAQLDILNDQLKQAEELLSPDTPPDLRSLAENEVPSVRTLLGKQRDLILREIEKLEQPPDLDDVSDIILEIRAGTGGEEAALFASDLLRMYSKYAQSKGYSISILDQHTSENGGIREIIAKVSGPEVYRNLRFESGVHRVQRIPTTESSGRIHTSTASVAIMPEAQEIDIEVRTEDVKIDTFRASGAGGQHVNKTDSAIRMTHIPTGIIVSCQESRSQLKNRETALSLLRTRLYNRQIEENAEKRGSLRRQQIGSAKRSEKIRTYNFPQSRITDHRIKKSWHDIDKILDGHIDEIIADLNRSEEQTDGNQA